MAGAIGRYLVESHLREGRSVAELARVHGVHRSWLYKLLARHRQQGDEGLLPRSRRPRSCPHQISPRVVDAILTLRRELADDGHDAGAETIAQHLRRRLTTVPAVA